VTPGRAALRLLAIYTGLSVCEVGMRINQVVYNCLTSIKGELEKTIEDYDPELSEKLDFIQQWLDDSEITITIPTQITSEWYRNVYLQSDHWQKIKKEALREAKGLCQLCNKDQFVNVHHRTYENLGHEDIKDVIVLCLDCHSKFHVIGAHKK